MRYVISVLVLSLLLFTGGTCLAADGSGAYVKGIVKYVMPADPEIEGINTDMDNGFGWGGAVGWAFNQFRVEGELSTQKTDLDAVSTDTQVPVSVDSGDIRMTTFLVNGYWDIPVQDKFGVYLTAGLGYGNAEVSIYNIDGDDGGLAWKVGAGVSYLFQENMAFDLGWEYVTMDDADLDVTVEDLYTNNIVAAFRFMF